MLCCVRVYVYLWGATLVAWPVCEEQTAVVAQLCYEQRAVVKEACEEQVSVESGREEQVVCGGGLCGQTVGRCVWSGAELRQLGWGLWRIGRGVWAGYGRIVPVDVERCVEDGPRWRSETWSDCGCAAWSGHTEWQCVCAEELRCGVWPHRHYTSYPPPALHCVRVTLMK